MPRKGTEMIHGVPTLDQQVLVGEGRVGRGRDFFLVKAEGTRTSCGAQGKRDGQRRQSGPQPFWTSAGSVKSILLATIRAENRSNIGSGIGSLGAAGLPAGKEQP